MLNSFQVSEKRLVTLYEQKRAFCRNCHNKKSLFATSAINLFFYTHSYEKNTHKNTHGEKENENNRKITEFSEKEEENRKQQQQQQQQQTRRSVKRKKA